MAHKPQVGTDLRLFYTVRPLPRIRERYQVMSSRVTIFRRYSPLPHRAAKAAQPRGAEPGKEAIFTDSTVAAQVSAGRWKGMVWPVIFSSRRRLRAKFRAWVTKKLIK